MVTLFRGAASRKPARSEAVEKRAQALAATLPPLMVAAERVAATVAQGVHGRRRVGQGETFWQFRPYQPGDPIQRIDWRQTAKSRPVYVRELEWEAAESVWLWRDGSASMAYRSRAELPEKIDRAELILVALAWLLVRGGERIALLGSGRRPATGRVAIERLTAALGRDRADTEGGLPPFELLPRHGRLVLIGDFLDPVEEYRQIVGRFAARGVTGHLLQVTDLAEESLPFRGRNLFEGLEDDGTLLVNRSESLRDAYIERLARQRAGLADIARAAGWSFAVHRTNEPPQVPLLALYGLIGEIPEHHA